MSTPISQKSNEAKTACYGEVQTARCVVGNATGNVYIPNHHDHVCPHCGRCKHCGQPVPPVINPVYPQPIIFPPNTPPWPGYPDPYIGDPINPPYPVTCGGTINPDGAKGIVAINNAQGSAPESQATNGFRHIYASYGDTVHVG